MATSAAARLTVAVNLLLYGGTTAMIAIALPLGWRGATLATERAMRDAALGSHGRNQPAPF